MGYEIVLPCEEEVTCEPQEVGTGPPTIASTASPSSGPTSSPSDSPTSSPSKGPTSSPSDSPTSSPSKGPTSSPSDAPTVSPSKSMNPTDCYAPASPKVVDSICMDGQQTIEPTKPMPEGALVATSYDGDKIGFTVSQNWIEEAGMAIMHEPILGSQSCDIRGNVLFGKTDDFEAECSRDIASV